MVGENGRRGRRWVRMDDAGGGKRRGGLVGKNNINKKRETKPKPNDRLRTNRLALKCMNTIQRRRVRESDSEGRQGGKYIYIHGAVAMGFEVKR